MSDALLPLRDRCHGLHQLVPDPEALHLFLPTSQILLHPLNPLPRRIVHCLHVLLATPIAPQRKPMHLVLVQPNLMRQILFACHQDYNLPSRRLV